MEPFSIVASIVVCQIFESQFFNRKKNRTGARIGRHASNMILNILCKACDGCFEREIGKLEKVQLASLHFAGKSGFIKPV